MYAVFRSGGKQYRVSEGETLRLERLDAEEGTEIEFDDVLMVGEGEDVKIGTPVVKGAKVTAKVNAQARHDTVRVQKFKRRQGYKRLQGHRQQYTEVKITGIHAG